MYDITVIIIMKPERNQTYFINETATNQTRFGAKFDLVSLIKFDSGFIPSYFNLSFITG